MVSCTECAAWCGSQAQQAALHQAQAAQAAASVQAQAAVQAHGFRVGHSPMQADWQLPGGGRGPPTYGGGVPQQDCGGLQGSYPAPGMYAPRVSGTCTGGLPPAHSAAAQLLGGQARVPFQSLA